MGFSRIFDEFHGIFYEDIIEDMIILGDRMGFDGDIMV